ncbi:MAG TPA: cell division protein FtsH, partial [Streptosporangiaceae bacterium]
MTKQASPPPPGDKPSPSAPPPPPTWRHWLWPLAIVAALVLWIVLPAAHSTPQVSLNYSQFQSKVDAHQVK